MLAFVEDAPDEFLAEHPAPKVGRHAFREIRKLAFAARATRHGGREYVFSPVRMSDDHLACLIARAEHPGGFARELSDREFLHV